MEANKSPEKLYLFEGEPILSARSKKVEGAYIEYTHTDAFIEKACTWLENNLSKYSELTNEDEYGNKLSETVMNVFHGQAVKDFRNYMKGE